MKAKYTATWCSWAVKQGGSKSWLPRVEGKPARGDLVKVVRKDGSSEIVKVVKVLWSGQSKYDDTVQSVVDFTDPDDDVPSNGNRPIRANTAVSSAFSSIPVQSSSEAWREGVRLPNGALLTIIYQKPLQGDAGTAVAASTTESPPAGDADVDGGIPF